MPLSASKHPKKPKTEAPNSQGASQEARSSAHPQRSSRVKLPLNTRRHLARPQHTREALALACSRRKSNLEAPRPLTASLSRSRYCQDITRASRVTLLPLAALTLSIICSRLANEWTPEYGISIRGEFSTRGFN